MPIASRPIQRKSGRRHVLFSDAILFTGLILTWGAIPWLYFRPPQFLLGQPVPFYAMACLFLGIGFFNTLLLKNLKRFAGKNIWAHNLSNRKGRFAVILVFTLIIAVPYFLSPFAPSQCSYKSVVVAIANAQGQNCTQTCTNWSTADCQGWSSCFNKLIECTNGIDQNGRPCQGCCFDCKVVCQNTDDPPTINGNVTCTQSGQNNWCVNNAQLTITTSDPQGYAVTISGNLNGSPFTCGSSCTLDLPSGTGTANYTATASTSGLSDSGSSTWKYDPDDPIPGLNISGASGSNGWYISPVSVAAAGTDSISGMAGASLSVDGGAEQSSAILNDGAHQVTASAVDNAGRTASSTFSIYVDTATPLINSSLTAASGSNGWYVSDVEVSASASDATSGIESFEVSVDGSWQTYATPITLTDGQHTIQFRATDQAGNVTTTNVQQFMIDTVDPVITTTISGSSGTNSWYTSDVQVSAVASDSGSSLDTFEVSMDGNAWQTYSAPLSFTSGQHTLQFRASDLAGNVSQITRNVSLDSTAPIIDLPPAWALGKTVSYMVTDNESGLGSVRVVIEDENEKYAKVTWDEDVSGDSFGGEIGWDGKWKDGTVAPPGTYLVWVKAKDKAGNESMKLGKVTVPEQFNWFGLILPTKTPKPTPAQSIVEVPTSQAIVPLTSNKSTVMTSTGSTGGLGNGQSAPNPMQSNLPLVSAAIAAMTAVAAYAMKKQEEGTAGPSLYRQIAKAYTAAQEEKKRRRELEREEDQIEDAYRRAHIVPASSNLRAYDDIEDLRAQRKDTSPQTTASQPWWQKTLDDAKTFVQDKIIQPAQKAIKPILDNPAIHKAVVQTVVTVATIAGLGTTYQWYQNVVNNSDLFLDLQHNAQIRFDQLNAQYPDLQADSQTKWENLRTKPYESLSAGLASFEAFTDTLAEYADTVWQQNPVVQFDVKRLTSMEEAVCSKITNHALSNGCTGAFYLAAGMETKPFDTTLGVANTFIVDPIAGLVKLVALDVEHPIIPELVKDIQKDGLSGIGNFFSDRWNLAIKVIATDRQVDSALMLVGLLALAFGAPLLAAGIVLGLTGKGLIDAGTTVAQAADKQTVIQYVTSRQVRTLVVSSAIILGLMGLGISNKISEFNAFQDGLSPSGQVAFQELSLLEQTRLADLAIQMKLPPGAVDFYLIESARLGSPLADLPLAEGLRVSALAEQSGQSAFVLDYLSRFGMDNALKNATPEGLQFYIEQAKTPGSTLSRLTLQEGVTLSELSPASIAKVTGMTTPTIPKGVVPDVNTPVLGLTQQEIGVLAKLSAQNPNADYAVLGLWNHGQGYTVVGSEGYTYLDMPEAIYDFFRNYPGDFRLVNTQYLDDLASQNKPIILETPFAELPKYSTAYWEVRTMLETLKYTYEAEKGPSNYDLLTPPR